MSAERYTTERSNLDKKPEWVGALVGHHHRHRQQHAHFLHHHQQNVQQTQRAHAHHQQLVGGCLDGATFQPDAGISCAEMVLENPNATIDVRSIQQARHFSMAADNNVRCDHTDVGATHMRPAASAPQERFAMLAPDTSTKNNHTSSVNILAEPQQTRSVRDHVICIGKGNLSMSASTKTPATRRSRNTSMSPLMVRPTGTKDRHSKVRTAKGLRDRRVRLSAPTAIQFFDVQDRLGYDQPSKAVDWLIKKARAAIDELAPVEGVIVGDETTDVPARERKPSKDRHHGSLLKVKDEEQSMAVPIVGDVRAESRAKARERARERAKEKCLSSTPSSATSGEAAAITSAATMPMQSFVPSVSPNVQLLPEFFLLSSHLREQFDDSHHPSDLSSMLPQPSSAPLAPHLLPLPPHFFAGPPPSSASSFVYPGDVPPPFQFSAPPIYTNTPISPRGTLQSIFSNPANSSMQAHMHMPPLNMMMGALQQAHAYGAVLNSVREDGHDNDDEFRQRSAELGSPDLHQHSRIPMRIHGMELDSRVEETRITPSSMQADFQ